MDPGLGCCILYCQKSYSPGRGEECHLLKSLLSDAGVLIALRQFRKWPLTSWCGLFMTMLVVIFHLGTLFTPLGVPTSHCERLEPIKTATLWSCIIREASPIKACLFSCNDCVVTSLRLVHRRLRCRSRRETLIKF